LVLGLNTTGTWGSERVVGVRLSPLPLLARLCSVPLSLAAPSRFLNVRGESHEIILLIKVNVFPVLRIRTRAGSSILGQCESGSESRVLMTKNFTILELKKSFFK
jgi:hypothetical protein